MVQRPFSDSTRLRERDKSYDVENYNMRLGHAKISSSVQKYHHPLATRVTLDIHKPKLKMKLNKSDELEARLSRKANPNISKSNNKKHNILLTKIEIYEKDNNVGPEKFAKEIYYKIPQSRFFPNNYGEISNIDDLVSTESIILTHDKLLKDVNKSSVIKPKFLKKKDQVKPMTVKEEQIQSSGIDECMEKADFFIEEIGITPNTSLYIPDTNSGYYDCSPLLEAEAQINVQELFSKLDIEPSWVKNKKYWNILYDSRYESLMRSSKWPALKVLLIPRTQVDTIWKQTFDDHHNGTVRNIISNIVKKLQFYKNLTFTWNEVSHFSKWWQTTSKKNRAAVRRLIKEERFEITTGSWVETDESTSHIFGLLHQLMEGHQWLKNNLNYLPEVAWFTNSVTHSPTIPYILSCSGITNLIITNIHFSIEQYLAEYQYSDFIWLQNWETDIKSNTKLNFALNKMGNDRYPEHAVATHYLQYNSAGFEACGPISEICQNEFDFENSNKNIDINAYNVKAKSELLLEQYSKTGTLSAHNIIIAPLGGAYHYQEQKAFDYQYNNYWKIADFVNFNQDIYKATFQFGTPKDYFASILNIHKRYPTLKGDFNSYADIKSGAPAYWTGFFTTRPSLKLLLRYLQSNLRSAEIMFTFAYSYNVFATYNTRDLIERLLNAREIVARLQDRHVVGGTLTARIVRYVYTQILSTIKDCWYIQEVAASFLSSKPGSNKVYLEKYIYRDGDFFSFYKSIISGDQIYIFNSLSQERSDVVELTTRTSNLRILDHNNKDVAIQIKPVWQYTTDNMISISRQFFKIIFIISLPPLSFALFKVKETSDVTQTLSAIYCIECSVESMGSESDIPFDINPIDRGDVQVENYKYRLTVDEATGFLKKVTEKMTGTEKILSISYGAFRSSYKNSGMFLFKTNESRPLYDILLPYRLGAKRRIMIIISGQIITEVTSIFGKLLQHTVQIFNVIDSPLKNILKIESRVDYEVSPKHREMEIYLSLQADIANGDAPEVFVDNNGFQYTSHFVNISRRSESNMYPMTSMAYIQDKHNRLTVITDHTQGVTALQEGQLAIMLDRRVLYNDYRGTDEGIADNCAMTHRHILLLENLSNIETESYDKILNMPIQLPSPYANYFANIMNYPLDIYFIGKNLTNFCYYVFHPLVKSSFPCDVSVLNFRMFVHKGYKIDNAFNAALITLHRQTFSCRTHLEDSINCKGDSRFNLYKIFHNMREVYKTNVVGTQQGLPTRLLDLTNFKPMELMTLRLVFETQ